MKRGKGNLIFVFLLFSIILFSSLISAINTCPEGYQVNRGGSALITCFSYTTRCDIPATVGSGTRIRGKYSVSYSESASGIFVPTRTRNEWNSFFSSYSSVTGITVAEGDSFCTCTPGCRDSDCDRCLRGVDSECAKLCWDQYCHGHNEWCY